MTNRQERIVYTLMAANAAIFGIVFCWVSYNYRLAADDFHYLIKSKELGVWDAMVFYYNNWNPRWSATLVTNSVLGNYSSPTTLLAFQFSTLILGFISIRSFISGLVQQLKLPFSSGRLSILSIYLLAALFYGSFSKDDTWFWVTVGPMYLWGSFAALLGGSLLLHSWNRGVRTVLASLLFLYAGGASETVAMASIISLFLLGFLTHKRAYAVRIDRTALHVATISCLIGFGICLVGPGAHIRYEHLPHYSLSDKTLVGFWNYIRFNLKEIPLLLPAFAIAVSPLAFFGRKQLQFQLISIREIFWVNRNLWILADVMIILLSFALAFAMGEMGPTRAWIPLTFLVLTVSLVIAYQLGTWVYIKTKGRLFHLVVVAQLIGLSYQVGMGYYQITTTTTYANAVDNRMKEIPLSMKRFNDIVSLNPLPDSGWLFSAEITTDTAHFTNKHLSLFFGGSHDFVLKEELTSTIE